MDEDRSERLVDRTDAARLNDLFGRVSYAAFIVSLLCISAPIEEFFELFDC